MKALKIAGGVLAVLIVSLLFVPFFLDLDSYKGLISEKTREATGRDLVIDGDISLSLFPIPSVSVEGIKFGNAAKGSAANMAEIEKFTGKVALLPLLSSKVEIRSIELVHPIITLEKLADGKGNWELAPAAGAEAALEPTAEGESGSSGFDLSVQRASIIGGTLVYRDIASGSEQRIEALDVDLSLGSMQGPFNATGRVTSVNVPLRFDIDVGRRDPAQPMSIEVTLEIEGAGARIGFSGRADLAAAESVDRPILTGKLTGKGDSVAKLMAVLSGADAAAGPRGQGFALDGEIVASKSLVELENFTVTLGDATAKGAVAAKLGDVTSVDAQLAMGRLDLDALMPARAAAPAVAKQAPAAPAPGKFALPADLRANVTVTIDQVVVQGNAVDQVKVVAVLANAKLDFTEVSAQLSGATRVKLGGALTAQNGQPAFAGRLDARSGNPRALIDSFAKGAVDSVPGERLRTLALESRVTFTPHEVALVDLTAHLDASRITGGVTVALPDGRQRQRMSFGVAFSVDQMNLDGYLPKPAEGAAEGTPADASQKPGGNPLKALAPLGDLDAEIELSAGVLTLDDQQIQKLHVLIGLASGVLTIEDLSVGDLMGGKAVARGRIVELAGNPRLDLVFDVTARDANQLARMAGAEPAGNLGSLSLKGKAQSGAGDLAYDIELALSGIGGAGNLSGKITRIWETPALDALLDFRADRPAALLQWAGLAGPKAQQMGALAAKGSLKGAADALDLDLGLQAAGATVKLAGNVRAKAEPMVFDLSLRANHPEFTQLLMLVDLPSSGARAGPLDLTARARGTTRKAAVSSLDFRWGGSNLSGEADYDATGARPMIRATLAGGTVDLVPLMGAESGKSSGGRTGGARKRSPWSNEPLDLSALRGQDADVVFKASSLILPDQRIDDLVAKLAIEDGVLRIDTLTGSIYGGGFDLAGTSVDARSTPRIATKVAITRIQIGQVMGGGIGGNQVKGPLSLHLDLTGTGESQAAIVRSLGGKGDLGGTLMILGTMEQTVGSALLGVLGQQVKQVKGVADGINGVIGSFTGVDNQLSGSFDVSQGVLDTRDFAFTNPRARGTVKGKIDLGAWALDLLVDLFGQQTEQAFMSINLTGPVNGPTPSFSGSGAAGQATGPVPGLNLPGLGIIPGFGGIVGEGVRLPGGLSIPRTATPGTAIPGTGGGEPGKPAAAPAGGLLEGIPGVGDLLGGGKKKQRRESMPAVAEPRALPAEAAPPQAAPAPIEEAPAARPRAANPRAAEPSAEEPAPSDAAPTEAAPLEPAAVPEEPLPPAE